MRNDTSIPRPVLRSSNTGPRSIYIPTGPKTESDRLRCGEAKTIHGNETRKARSDRAAAMRRLRLLEDLGHAMGIMLGQGRREESQLKERFPYMCCISIVKKVRIQT